MQLDPLLTDEAVLRELGARLARQRLDLGLTQAEVAERAGISKRTLERLENGGASQLVSFIRILRVLESLGALEAVLPDTGPAPMALLRGGGKPPQRARRRAQTVSGTDWSWDEDP
jgi:transcriptional regulator with XRE-family HTH domain